jgi:hypothetical protein
MMDDDVSDLAMEIMAAVDSGRGLPRSISRMDMLRLSEYECLTIDKAIRNRGRVLEYAHDGGEFTIRDDGN